MIVVVLKKYIIVYNLFLCCVDMVIRCLFVISFLTTHSHLSLFLFHIYYLSLSLSLSLSVTLSLSLSLSQYLSFCPTDTTVQARSFSTGLIPACCPLAFLFNCLFFWVPFSGNGFNSHRLDAIKKSVHGLEITVTDPGPSCC